MSETYFKAARRGEIKLNPVLWLIHNYSAIRPNQMGEITLSKSANWVTLLAWQAEVVNRVVEER